MVDQPHHGGRLHQAAELWGIAPEQWLDLSTGINPSGWPVPAIPDAVWQRLPDPDDGLNEVLRHWTGAHSESTCLPVSGSQAAIMALPTLRAPCRVGVPAPGYQEHGHGWQRQGHRIEPIDVERMQGNDERWLEDLDVLVCINPNNPTGDLFSADRLQGWHRLGREPWFHLSSPRNGWDKKPKPHADYIDCADFPQEWRGLDATIDIEAKAKELAVLQLQTDLCLPPWREE
jgi:histidinol-phosphate/aromatic aminotransferase/cobyric acid decarboxylase-like protein